MAHTEHQRELVERVAPRWAWDAIDFAISEGIAFSKATGLDENQEMMERGNQAMIDACEKPIDV